MASSFSFDVVSKADLQEVDNAVNQAMREITNRFDFKGSVSNIERKEQVLTIISDDEYKLKSVIDVLQSKLIKRDVALKFLDYGKVEPASGATVRQEIKIKEGIPEDKAKKINKMIKDSKLKVQSQIQGDQLRISGKSKDDLQSVMQLMKQADLDLELQFANFR